MRGKKDAARHSLQKYRGVDDVEAELRVRGASGGSGQGMQSG